MFNAFLKESFKYISSIVLIGAITICFYGYASIHAYLKQVSVASNMVEFDYMYYYVNSVYYLACLILMMIFYSIRYIKIANHVAAGVVKVLSILITYFIPVGFWLLFIREFIEWECFWRLFCLGCIVIITIIDIFLSDKIPYPEMNKAIARIVIFMIIIGTVARIHGIARGNEVLRGGSDINRISFNLKEDNTEIDENKVFLLITYNKGRYFFIDENGEEIEERKLYVLSEDEIFNAKITKGKANSK